METLWQDLKYGARQLARSPGFTAVAVLTLALGIGATTAIFSVLNAVLLRPLPYEEPDRLAILWTDDPKHDVHEEGTSYLNFLDWRRESRLFADMAIYSGGNPVTLSGSGASERVVGELVSANLFPLLGVKPALGRTFSSEEEQHRERVLVLSHGLWVRRFGAAPDAIRKTLELNGYTFQVVGVMPSSFYFPSKDVQLWMPATLLGLGSPNSQVYERTWERRFTDWWRVVGRLKPNVGVPEGQAEMTAIGGRLAEAYPTAETGEGFAGFGVRVVPLVELFSGKNLQLALCILFGAVGFVLLIACANVANLLLARGVAREREFAIRASLGARPIRLLQQVLTESVMLALAGGLAGLGVAVAGVRIFSMWRPLNIPRLDEVSLDSHVLLFTAGLSFLAGILFGAVPARKMSQSDTNQALKEGIRVGLGGVRLTQPRSLLVVAECALAVVLLVGAGLLIRSFLRVQSVNPGFRPAGVLLLRVSLPLAVQLGPGAEARTWALFEQVTERIAAFPGVRAAGAIEDFLIRRNPQFSIEIEGRPPTSNAQEARQLINAYVTPGFFEAAGVPLIRGRFFSKEDVPVAGSERVAILNEALARAFSGEDPIGKRFKEGAHWYTVVGVVGNMHRQGLEREAIPQFFIPSVRESMDLLVRADSDPQALTPMIRDAIRSIDNRVVVSAVTTLEDRVNETTAQRRFQTWLLVLLASLALALSAVGIFGVMHQATAQRTHEIGIRIALGAQPADILRLVIGQGMKLASIGVLIGLGAASWLTDVMPHLLFGVTSTDPVTFVGVPLVLAVAALVACWVPARRAARVDPMVALRYE